MNQQKLNYCTQFLSESTSVDQWNQRRDELQHQGMTTEVCSLESSGLIVKILGPDPVPFKKDGETDNW